jgi:hypothetical protein
MSGDIEKLHLRDQDVDVINVIDGQIQQVVACVGAINSVWKNNVVKSSIHIHIHVGSIPSGETGKPSCIIKVWLVLREQRRWPMGKRYRKSS